MLFLNGLLLLFNLLNGRVRITCGGGNKSISSKNLEPLVGGIKNAGTSGLDDNNIGSLFSKFCSTNPAHCAAQTSSFIILSTPTSFIKRPQSVTLNEAQLD